MASAIGDVTWLQQSLYDTRKAYSVSKEHVSVTSSRTPVPSLYGISTRIARKLTQTAHQYSML